MKMYSDKLEGLISAALADGQLTEQKRKVLLRKAQEENVDIDEFTMVLDARIVECQKRNMPPIPPAARQTSAKQSVMKCPACGALRTSFAAICPDCGYEFNDATASDTIKNFFNEISQYDERIASESPKKKSIVGTIFLWWFLFPFMLIYFIIKTGTKSLKSLTGTKKLKANAIKMFPIPNSRNDLMEAAVLMQGEVKPVGILSCLTNAGAEDVAWNKVWLAKLNSIVKKAEISMAGDSNSLQALHNIQKEAVDIVKTNTRNQYIIVGLLAVLFIGFIVLLSYN